MKMKTKVAIVKCGDYEPERVTAALRRAFDLFGGIGRTVPAGRRVLIKPNLLSARAPETAVCTHPEVVRALIRLVREAGGIPRVGDSPGGLTVRAGEVFSASGMKAMCDQEGVEMVRFREVRQFDGIPIAREALEAEVLISVPKFKTHGLTVLTGAVKNMFGTVPGLFKSHCHRLAPEPESMSRLLVRIFSRVRPHFSVMDGITVIEGEGPGVAGRRRNLGLLLASADAVSLDEVCGRIMGLPPLAVATTRIAGELGLGNADLRQIEIAGENPENLSIAPFLLPRTTTLLHRLPRRLLLIAARFHRTRVEITRKKCRDCGICLEVCPVKTVVRKKGRPVINQRKCILCLCCLEQCPHAAVEIRKSLLARMI